MSGHTPGPWKVRYEPLSFVISADDRQVCSFSWHDSSKFYPTQAEAEANAKLIAAAPALVAELAALRDRAERAEAAMENEAIITRDLRKALQGVVDAWVNPGDGQPFEDGEVPELDAARAALSPEHQREEGK